MYVHTCTTHAYTQPAKRSTLTDTVSAQINQTSINSLILFPSLSGQGQDEGPFVENAHTDRRHNVDPSSNWPETLSLASGCPWIPGLPSCWHLGTWPSSAAAPFPLPVQNTLAHTWKCTHTHRHTCWGPLYVQPTLRPLSLYFSTLVPPQNTLTLQFPAYGPPLSIP